jgi:hypothetical protein
MRKDGIKYNGEDKEKNGVGSGKATTRNPFAGVRLLIEEFFIGAALGLSCASGGVNPQQLTPVETKIGVSVYEGEVPEGTNIVAVMCANGFIASALSVPDSVNPLWLGLGAHIYYAIANANDLADSKAAGRLRGYADAVLEQAIYSAKYNNYADALLLLADIYKMDVGEQGRRLGVTRDEIITWAKKIIEEGKAEPCYILPSGEQKVKAKTVVEREEGADIIALMYANRLIADALSDPDNVSPMKLALGAEIYIVAARTGPADDSAAARMLKYGLRTLDQAADIAIAKKDPYSLTHIADVYEVLLNMPDRATKLRDKANNMQPPYSVDYLVPVDYQTSKE